MSNSNHISHMSNSNMSNSNHISRISSETIDAIAEKRAVATIVIVILSSIAGFLLTKKYLTIDLLIEWFV